MRWAFSSFRVFWQIISQNIVYHQLHCILVLARLEWDSLKIHKLAPNHLLNPRLTTGPWEPYPKKFLERWASFLIQLTITSWLWSRYAFRIRCSGIFAPISNGWHIGGYSEKVENGVPRSRWRKIAIKDWTLYCIDPRAPDLNQCLHLTKL